MKQLLLWLVVILGSIILLTYGLSKLNETAANKYYAKGQARAMVIEAQGQARLDTATANAINQAANLPYVVLGLVAVFGGAILILAVVILRQQQDTKIERIETRIILLPQIGSRRETYQMLSDGVKLLRD